MWSIKTLLHSTGKGDKGCLTSSFTESMIPSAWYNWCVQLTIWIWNIACGKMKPALSGLAWPYVTSPCTPPFLLLPPTWSFEVPFRRTQNLVCTAWAQGWGVGGGLSLRTSLAEWRGSRASKHHAAAARITDSLTAGMEWTAWCGSRSPLCLGSLCLCFSFSHSSQLCNEHCWLRERRREKEWERESQCDCVCMCLCEWTLIAWI